MNRFGDETYMAPAWQKIKAYRLRVPALLEELESLRAEAAQITDEQTRYAARKEELKAQFPDKLPAHAQEELAALRKAFLVPAQTRDAQFTALNQERTEIRDGVVNFLAQVVFDLINNNRTITDDHWDLAEDALVLFQQVYPNWLPKQGRSQPRPSPQEPVVIRRKR